MGEMWGKLNNITYLRRNKLIHITMKTILTSKIPANSPAEKFWSDHSEEIRKYASCFRDTDGFVRIIVDENFKIKLRRFIRVKGEGYRKMRSQFFVRTDFNRSWEDKFFPLYYEISFPSLNTKVRFGESNYFLNSIHTLFYNLQ